MFYQVTDNIAADCNAYDRWCAENERPMPLCADCGAEGEVFGINVLYKLNGEEICADCLKSRYTDELGAKFAEAYAKDFARWRYPDSDIDDGLAIDIWLYILRPQLVAAQACPHLYKNELGLLKEFVFEDEDAWCEWLNKNI